MNNKKVLVTGGTGFIGSHAVVELINNGYEVIVADDLSNSRLEVVDAFEKITGTRPVFIQIDLCDSEKTNQLFQQYKPAAIVHFAAKKLVGESVQQPLNYYRTNLVSLMNVMEAAIANECRNLVFSSSCTVYGQPDKLPVNENAPRKDAESPYGNTKRISEDILTDLVKTGAMKVISLRYFNPVGAHESALIGEYPLGPPANLMPVLTQAAIGKRDSVCVFGNDYNTPDGSCVRDYIHVDDVAAAHAVALEMLFQKNDDAFIDYYNLGTGVGVSVLEMIRCFEETNHLKLKYSIAPRRPGDVEQVWADTTKANTILKWKATRSLGQMVASAWAWEKNLAGKIKV